MTCWAHVWRAIMKNQSKLKDRSQEKLDQLYTHLCYIHEANNPKLRDWLVTKFIESWRRAGEGEMVDYLASEHLYRKWSRCDGEPGDPTDSNTLERFNQHIKGENHFNSVEGAGTVIERAVTVGNRISRDMVECATAPMPTKKDWKKAQAMIKNGWCHLGFKHQESYVFPSEHLLASEHITKGATVPEKKQQIKVWVKEYSAMVRPRQPPLPSQHPSPLPLLLLCSGSLTSHHSSPQCSGSTRTPPATTSSPMASGTLPSWPT